MRSPAFSLPQPQTDLKGFRLSRINEPEYRHMWYLLFWPVYGLRYLILENMEPLTPFHLIHSPIDDLIPFQEWFVIPYMLWYIGLAGMHIYTMVYDVASFRRYSRFLILSMSVSSLIFILYPSCQDLRPEAFPRENILTWIVGVLYTTDTNTNTFPSEHVIGAIAIFCASLHTKGLHSPVKTTVFAVMTVLVCLSTVFIKQHSICDVLAAMPVCAVAYWICYRKSERNETISRGR